MSSSVWSKPNYRSGAHFLIDGLIREFDITKANISVLRDANVLSESQYRYFLQCPKLEREIAIGKMEGNNPEISKIKKEGITQARKAFMTLNGIQDSEVLEIRNDSISIIGNRPINVLQVSDRVFFREDGRYTSYYHLGTIDYYYYANIIENIEHLAIKGMSDEAIQLHQNFMLDLLNELFYRAQFEGVKSAIPILNSFYKSYIAKELPVGYYRELTAQSMYKLNNASMISSIYIDMVTEHEKPAIDISENEKVLRELNRIFASIYFGST